MMRQFLIRLFLASFVVGSLIIALQPMIVAWAVTCSGSGCNNTDPGITGCAQDAATVKRAYPSERARVELRFSDTCQTRWARTFNIADLNYWANATLRYYYYYNAYIGPGYNVYSNQRYGSGYRACGDVRSAPMNYLINDIQYCTGSY